MKVSIVNVYTVSFVAVMVNDLYGNSTRVLVTMIMRTKAKTDMMKMVLRRVIPLKMR